MSDSGFREVQLSGKQVVFLFITCVVALVATFLLGVSVGRGVIQPDATVEATPTPPTGSATSGTPVDLPPPSTPKPGELQYHETLQGKPEGKGAAPVTTPPLSTPTPTATPTPAPTKSTPTAKPTAPTPPTAKPASATATWYVQLGAYSTNDNALKYVAELKTKGVDASVFDARGTGARYKVSVGPFERAAAEARRARLLKEGFKSSLVSR